MTPVETVGPVKASKGLPADHRRKSHVVQDTRLECVTDPCLAPQLPAGLCFPGAGPEK